MIDTYLTDSNSLLVSFGGLALQYGMPVPEFKRILKPIDVNKIFVIDEYRCWYYTIYEDVINELRNLIDKIQPLNTIFFGCSAGGYASILFGLILEVDRTMSFQTQTFLSQKSRQKYKDVRWEKEVNIAYKYSNGKELDLWNHDKECKTVIELFYCEDFYISKIHAELLYEKTNYLNIVLNKYQCGDSYPLARNLKESGDLLKIFKCRLEKMD
jgi:hypothetical protein